jgi:hypothetical protein
MPPLQPLPSLLATYRREGKKKSADHTDGVVGASMLSYLVQLQLVRFGSGLWTDTVRPYLHAGDWDDGKQPSPKDRLKLH